MKIMDMITQDEFDDVLSTSPHFLSRKWIGVTNENSNFGFEVLRVKVPNHEILDAQHSSLYEKSNFC